MSSLPVDKSLLDTDIASEVVRGLNVTVVAHGKRYAAEFDTFTTSAVTVVEITHGLHRLPLTDRRRRIMEQVLAFEILPLDSEAAQIAGRITAELEQIGQPIGRMDPMVAAVALRYRLPLVTGNTAHFQRIQALGYPLRLENWRV